MPSIKLILLIGGYAQAAYLNDKRERSLTEAVRAWKDYLPRFLPLPHPSPLNNIWLHKNRWFQDNELSEIKKVVRRGLKSSYA